MAWTVEETMHVLTRFGAAEAAGAALAVDVWKAEAEEAAVEAVMEMEAVGELGRGARGEETARAKKGVATVTRAWASRAGQHGGRQMRRMGEETMRARTLRGAAWVGQVAAVAVVLAADEINGHAGMMEAAALVMTRRLHCGRAPLEASSQCLKAV